jgi:hypothetical protein
MFLDTYLIYPSPERRIVALTGAMPEGFQPTFVDSKLPAPEPQRPARGAGRTGEWTFTWVGARWTHRQRSVRRRIKDWPAEEIWGFQADRSLRVVDIEGASPIDLTQRRAIPGYTGIHRHGQSELKLVEQFRGDRTRARRLHAVAKLSFDGSNYTVRDTLNGTVNDRRVGGQFVPAGSPSTRTGVDHQLDAGARASNCRRGGTRSPQSVNCHVLRSTRPSVGNRRRASISTLHLPPGWRLLWTHGVDGAPTRGCRRGRCGISSSSSSRSCSLAATRAHGGALAAVTLVVVYHEPGAPIFTWIALLVLLAALRSLTAVLMLVRTDISWSCSDVAVLGFAIDNLRIAVYHNSAVRTSATPCSRLPPCPVRRWKLSARTLGAFQQGSEPERKSTPRHYGENTQADRT